MISKFILHPILFLLFLFSMQPMAANAQASNKTLTTIDSLLEVGLYYDALPVAENYFTQMKGRRPLCVRRRLGVCHFVKSIWRKIKTPSTPLWKA
ncbi:MAG: hypothetical protein HC892_11220 [Saprospiraceae bacterium]|nr:hypothetical protein [Saprospiraceae bacterium]